MGSVEDVVNRMKGLVGAIPPRPNATEVEQARHAVRDEDRNLTSRLGELYQEKRPSDVPDSMFSALQELHESVIRTQSDVRKKDALFLLQLEDRHRLFEDLLQKAEVARPAAIASTNSVNHVEDGPQEDGKLQRSASGPQPGATEISRSLDVDELKPEPRPVEPRPADVHGLAARTQEEGRLLFASQQRQQPRSVGTPPGYAPQGYAQPGYSPTGYAPGTGGYQSPQITQAAPPLTTAQEEVLVTRWPPNLLEILETAEDGGKQPESLNYSNGGYNWLPDSIGILDNLTILNLSGNHLTAIPGTIGALKALVELDLESNRLKSLPESIGDLSNLQRLNLEKNSIEEIPYTIGGCVSLVEMRLDFNQLKALPEAVGQLRDLQYLSVHLNALKSVPTTLQYLSKLTDLFVNFNHLDTLPESLCALTGLTRLDASSNFAEFRYLPNQFGNLQGLRDLDLSFNHITVLPDSFTKLTNLRSLKLEGNPWRLPPLETVAEGKDAIFEYMKTWREKDQEAKKAANKSAISKVFSCCGSKKDPLFENKFKRVKA